MARTPSRPPAEPLALPSGYATSAWADFFEAAALRLRDLATAEADIVAAKIGTTTNDNAAAGHVGEYISSAASGVALTSGVIVNITSISLTPGDWEVSGGVIFLPAATTAPALFGVGVSEVSATFNRPEQLLSAAFSAGITAGLSAMPDRFSLAITETVYLVALANFTVSAMAANGIIRARRMR